jgi:PAS domain S-box-containing protein
MKNSSSEDVHALKNRLLNDILLWISLATTPGVLLSVSRALVIGWLPVMGMHIVVLFSIWALWLGRRIVSYRVRVLGLLALMWMVSVGGLVQLGPLGVGGIFVMSFSFVAVLFLGNRQAWRLIACNVLSLIVIGIAASRHWLHFDLDYPTYVHHPLAWANAIWTFSAYSFIFALFGCRLMNLLMDREQAIRQERDLNHYYLDAVQSIMVSLDPTGRITMINRKGCELMGREKRDLLGQNWFECAFPQPLGMKVLYPSFLATLRGTECAAESMELPLVCREGGDRWVTWENACLTDSQGRLIGMLSSGMDITERKKAEAELQQYREHLEETVDARTAELRIADAKLRDTVFALESVGTAIFWAEVDTGRLLYVNQHAANMLGYEQSEMLALAVPDIDANVTQASYPNIANIIREHRYLRFDTLQRRKDGSQIPVEMTVYFQGGEEESRARFIGFGVDISERKAIEQALREAKQMAEESSLAKDTFLANMSHEIRTPVSAILGFTDLSLAADPPERLRTFLMKTKAATSHLFSLVNDILDFSKIEAGMLVLERVEFSLDQVIENLALVMGDKAFERGLELVFDINANLPLHLQGDSLRLSQILMNLVGNAIKFSEKGTVAVSFKGQSTGGESLMLRVVVSDEGIGMSPEQQAVLFTAFHQADTSTTRRFGGTGLGLAISKSLVEIMGGHIWVDSEPARGSTFQFTVSLGVAGAKPADSAVLSHLAGQRVVVVDDNLAVRNALKNQLNHLGLMAEAYASWQEMQEKQAADGAPCLFLLVDDALPEFHNDSPLRAWADKAGSPLVAMASQHRADDLGGAIIKPVTMLRLRERINSLCGLALPTGLHAGGGSVIGDAAAIARSLGDADILLVEDIEINRDMMTELLRNVGLSVRCAVNGLEALREVETRRPDAVLMDCQMPVMDGYEATRRLRAQGRFANLPIIALTANALNGDRDHCLSAGMNEYLSKPVDLAELIRVLVRHVKPHAPAPVSVAVPQPIPAQRYASELPGIDLACGLARVNHNQALYFRLLGKFRTTYCQGFEADFQRALEGGDWQAAQRLAHSLKGTARTLGVELLGELAAQLEAAVKQAEPNAIPERLTPLVAELQRFDAGLDGLI